jgi:hypothetical protein
MFCAEVYLGTVFGLFSVVFQLVALPPDFGVGKLHPRKNRRESKKQRSQLTRVPFMS